VISFLVWVLPEWVLPKSVFSGLARNSNGLMKEKKQIVSSCKPPNEPPHPPYAPVKRIAAIVSLIK
jgi:hypothetical protein